MEMSYSHRLGLNESRGEDEGLDYSQTPENRYAYDTTLFALDLEYEGPSIGWGIIPDQYSLGYAHDRVFSEAESANAQDIVAYPNTFVQQPNGSNLRCVETSIPLDFPFNDGFKSTFLSRHAADTAVMTLEGTSVNHPVAHAIATGTRYTSPCRW